MTDPIQLIADAMTALAKFPADYGIPPSVIVHKGHPYHDQASPVTPESAAAWFKSRSDRETIDAARAARKPITLKGLIEVRQ